MTFFEVIVVMGIFAMVGGFALFVSMETYRGSSFHSDRNLLVATLQRARAQAINNICLGTCTDGKKHGVAIRPTEYPDSYVIFQTSNDYAARDVPQDAPFEASPISGQTGDSEIVFEYLSGNSNPASITLTGEGHTSVITIGAEGQITWTN